MDPSLDRAFTPSPGKHNSQSLVSSELVLNSFFNSDFDNKELFSSSLDVGAIAVFKGAKKILYPSLRNV